MLKNITFIAASLCLSASAHAYDSFEELMTDIGRKQVEAIKTYIAENPDAEDVNEAESQLVYGLIAQENFSEALAILQKYYAAFPDDKSAMDLSYAFGEVVVPMIQLYIMDRQKEEGEAFIKKVREAFSEHDMARQINQSLDEFLADLVRPAVGDEIELAFTAIDGRKVDVADMKGKVVLIDFWATWCPPCIQAIPELKSLYDTYHEKGFEIIGLAMDEDIKRVESLVKREKLAWPQYFDGLGIESELGARFGLVKLPTTYLLGPDGVIQAVDLYGPELREKIEELLVQE